MNDKIFIIVQINDHDVSMPVGWGTDLTKVTEAARIVRDFALGETARRVKTQPQLIRVHNINRAVPGALPSWRFTYARSPRAIGGVDILEISKMENRDEVFAIFQPPVKL